MVESFITTRNSYHVRARAVPSLWRGSPNNATVVKLLSKLSKFMRGLATSTTAQRRFVGLAWAGSPLVELTLKLAGLDRTVQLIEQLTDLRRGGPRGRRGPAINLAEGTRLVGLAFRAQPLLRGGCLERSLVQYGLHRLEQAGGCLARKLRGAVTGVPRCHHAYPEQALLDRRDAVDGLAFEEHVLHAQAPFVDQV